MSERSFRAQLGQIALSLVNATLMLAVLLVFGLWILLGRAQDFAADAARTAAGVVGEDLGERVAERAKALDTALAGLAALETRVDETLARAGTADGPAVAELAGLRSDVQALNVTVGRLADAAASVRDLPADAVGGFLSELLQSLASRLGPPQLPPT